MAAISIDIAPLAELHEGVGLPADERDSEMKALQDKFTEIMRTAVEEASARYDAMRAEVPDLQQKLAQLTDVVGADSATAAFAEGTDENAMALVPKRHALASAIEAADSVRTERLERRQAMESKIGEVRAELDGDDGEAREAAERRTSAPLPAADAKGGLTEALIGRLQRRLDDTNDERAKRVAAIEAKRAEVGELHRLLDYPAEATQSDRPISIAALRALEAQVDELQAEKQRRTEVLSQCLDYIAELRAELELPDAECASLPDLATAGLSQTVMEAIYAEMSRLDKLKEDSLAPLLAAARSRLRPLWKELYMSEEETKVCAVAWASDEPYMVPPAADDAADAEGAPAVDSANVDKLDKELSEVLAEERRLRAKLELCGKVLELMARREKLLAEHAEMLESAKDPSRLLKRGAAQLLKREEQVRTAFKNKLPLMTRELRKLTAEWEASAEANGTVLTFQGAPILQTLDAQETEERCAKEIAAKEKADKAGQSHNPRNSAASHVAPKKTAAAAAGQGKTAAAASHRPTAAKATKPPAAAGAPPPPPPPVPAVPPPALPSTPSERVPGEEPPQHAVPSPAVLQALNSLPSSLPTPNGAHNGAHNSLVTPAAPMKGRHTLEEAKENPLESA